MIRFLDLKKINSRYETELSAACNRVIQSGIYINGPELEDFEKAYADSCSARFCVGVNSGLDSLKLVLQAWKELGRLKDNDEVIVPANTYIATILAIIENNLKPVLVEPDPVTFNINAEMIGRSLTEKTRVILPVHLYGQLTDRVAIKTLASKHNCLVLEDAAQAHGVINGAGDAVAFSFYPTKNLGALGDAGAVITDDKVLYEMLLSLRNYGSSKKYINDHMGSNSRLDEIQAAMLKVKMKFLGTEIEKRRFIAESFLKNIKNELIELPVHSGQNSHAWHLFVIKTHRRTDLMDHLKHWEIESMIHYPMAPHEQPALRNLIQGNYPVTEKLGKKILSLPLHSELTESEVARIIECLNAFR